MIPIFFAFVSLIGWAVGDIFTTFASRKLGSFSASFYGYLFGLILSSLYLPFVVNQWKDFSLEMVFLTIFLTMFQLLAFLAYNEALKIGNSSLVGTIAGAFTSLVVILSLIFFKERITIQQLFSIIIIFIGIFLASINFFDLRDRKKIMNRGILLALLAMIGWGIYFTFIKIPVQRSGFFLPSFLTAMTGSLFLFLLGVKRIKIPKFDYKSGFFAAVLSGALLTIGSFAFNFAIGRGFSSVVASVAGAYPALFAFLAYFIFKDPIRNQQKFGMLLTLCGIILLSYFSR